MVRDYKPNPTNKGGIRLLRRLTRIYKAGGGICYLCGFAVIDPRSGVSWKHPAAASCDHVFPKSLGGAGGDNLALAHKWCNSVKSDRLVVSQEFLDSIKERMGRFLESLTEDEELGSKLPR